jgi:hypothetical protein
MPRRTLLSSEQRTRLFSIPVDAAKMGRHFVLSAEDLTLIRTLEFRCRHGLAR